MARNERREAVRPWPFFECALLLFLPGDEETDADYHEDEDGDIVASFGHRL